VAEERGELKSERALRVMKMTTTLGGIPFLKKDSPTDVPKHRRRPHPTRVKVTQSLTRGPGPMSHTLRASASVCGEGEPPREVHATTCGSAPLHLRRKQRPCLWRGGPGPRVILLGHRSPCAEKANRRVRSTPPSAAVRLFTFAETNSPISNMGAQAHESSPMGASSWVQRSRTTARASSGPL
jgi:hypothetical protein